MAWYLKPFMWGRTNLIHNDFIVSELSRRLNNIIKIGTVFEIDPVKAKVRVRIGELNSDWRPWATGSKHQWSMPQVGESVMMLSPSGETGDGIVIPSLYSTKNPPPSSDPNTVCWQLPADKTFIISVGNSKFEMTADKILIQSNSVEVVE